MSVTRRAALLAAPAVLLAGCGVDDDEPTAAQRRRADVAALTRFLEADAARTADADRHRDAVLAAIRRLGGPVPAVPRQDGGTRLPAAEALRAQERLVGLLLDITPRLADREARRVCAGILADEAGRIARLRLAAGQDAVPEAFVT